MSLNIKNDETEDLARRLAAATGESITQAVTTAVRERLDRVQQRDLSDASARAARVWEIVGDSTNRWIDPYRTADHGDLLYDDAGLPR
ncbi:MAG: type II toxin-antitoxin system VapB family antitoxin [Actinomycetota bacterium]|nr:type II toxin-antitoxin system VapB family antitoxin [Actinomycetota bacterium]